MEFQLQTAHNHLKSPHNHPKTQSSKHREVDEMFGTAKNPAPDQGAEARGSLIPPPNRVIVNG